MLTISKLDPRVKEAQKRRRDVASQVKVAALNERNPLKREAYIGFAHRLDKIRKNPRRSGAWKEAAFRRAWQDFAST